MALAMDEEKKQCELPNDVLVYILSKLNLREAIRSSIVSRDWRYAWSHGVTDLDFDAPWKFPCPLYEKIIHVHKDAAGWYVRWVNRVVESLCVEHINRFRVNFNFTKTWADDIDRWLAFAFEKRVKSLEFDFSPVSKPDLYPFPDISDPTERLRIFSSPVHVYYSSIKNLQSLSLISVRVSSQALEFFLSNCPLLEQLCICQCRELNHLRISGSSLPLKHLQIYNSFLRGGFEIDAPNLSSFECDYSLFKIKINKIKIGNIEKLTKLTIPTPSFLGNFCQYAPQLEELVIVNSFCPPYILKAFEGVKFLRLKHAELIIQGYDGAKNVFRVISNLLNAAPHLDTLKIDTGPIYLFPAEVMEIEMEVDEDTDDDVPTCHRHAFLKLVEIKGAIRDDYAEVARLLSRTAISIEMMVLGLPESLNMYPEEKICKMRTVLKQLAQELERTIPSRIQYHFPLD